MITHVAIKCNGYIYSMPKPNRHDSILHRFNAITFPYEEGFTDINGKFYSRTEAMQIAINTGTLKSRVGRRYFQVPELFSEDLW
jgi:hypothetical protein